MTNLLQETRDAIKSSGHTIEDVTFVGSADHEYECTWQQFELIADQQYDSGFGAAEVASDLVIEFSDGKSMWRNEYDGSEWWEYPPALSLLAPGERKPIINVIGGMWEKIEGLNGENR